MGGKTELYKRSSLVFFFLGVVALGLQLAGVILPFWVEDVWFPAAQQSFANKNKALFRVFQGLWSDYKCREGYRETSSAPEDHMQLTEGGELRYRACSIRMQSLHHHGPEDPIPGLLALRVLEVTSLGFGLLSVLGVTCLYVTARHYDCRRIASQALFTFSSLAAGLCAVVGVMILAGTVTPGRLAWGLVFPTVAGFLWLFNGSFAFVICRYDPTYGTQGNPVVRHAESHPEWTSGDAETYVQQRV